MLFKDKNELAAYIQIPAEQGQKLLQEADVVESERLIPVIGQTLYDVIAGWQNSPQGDKNKMLYKLCCAVVAPFIALRALPLLTASLTNNGLMVKEAGDSTRGAFQWEYREVMEAHTARGYAATEALLRWLRVNVADFPEFLDAPYNSPDRCQIIRDGVELASCLSVVQPHRCYTALLPFFNTVVDLYLEDVMTLQEYKNLNDRIISNGDAISQDDKNLLRLLRMAVAHAVMKHAAADLAIQFSANGFTIVDKITDAPEAGRRSATVNQLERFIAERARTSEAYFEKVRAWLNANASANHYPDYFNSSLYSQTATQAGSSEERAPYLTPSKYSFRM